MKVLSILSASVITHLGNLKERLTTGLYRRKKTVAILDHDFKIQLQRLIDERLKLKEVTD